MSGPEVLDVLVIGGGVSGLCSAYRLQQEGLCVRLLEAREEPGGNTRSRLADGFLMELGPHTLPGSADAVFALAEELGLGPEVLSTRASSGARFIVRNDRLWRAPTSMWSFITTRLLSSRAKLTLMTEPLRWRRGEDTDSAQIFFERRFGTEAARVLAGAFISGVYAGDPAQLSAPAAFPLFWEFEKSSGSLMLGARKYFRRRKTERREAGMPVRKGLFSFKGGLGRLSRALAEALGPAYQGGENVQWVERDQSVWRVHSDGATHTARTLVLAVPPHKAAQLLEGTAPELSRLLEAIPMAPLAVVHLGYREHQPVIPDGFGFLVPRGEKTQSLGVLFPSRLFEGRAPGDGDLLAGFVGGVGDPDCLERNDEELADIVRKDLQSLIGLDAEPDMVRVRRYRQAIPQPTLGHLDRMAAVKQELVRFSGLFLAGNYRTGVGMKDAVGSGLVAARDCLRYQEAPATPKATPVSEQRA